MSQITTVLLVSLCDRSTGAITVPKLPAEAQALLRESLEQNSSALAIAFGEYLACYAAPEVSVSRASGFLDRVDELAHRHPALAFLGARALIDIWPEQELDSASLDQMRMVLAGVEGHGVLLTQAARERLPQEQAAHCQMIHCDDRHAIYELEPREHRVTYRESTRMIRPATGTKASCLVLTRKGHEQTLLPEQCPATLGRDRTCTLMLGGNGISRHHARVLHEGGAFWVEDTSSNGTFLTLAGDEIYIHHSRFPLSGSGIISLGARLADQSSDVLRFRCDA